MKLLAPSGPVYQAGTLSGNPVAVAAGIATLRALSGAVYDRLETLGARLEAGIRGNLARLALPWQFQRAGSMATLFFTDRPVKSFRDAATCDTQEVRRVLPRDARRRRLSPAEPVRGLLHQRRAHGRGD